MKKSQFSEKWDAYVLRPVEQESLAADIRR